MGQALTITKLSRKQLTPTYTHAYRTVILLRKPMAYLAANRFCCATVTAWWSAVDDRRFLLYVPS